MPKSIKYSKTFWVNMLVVVVAGLSGMMGSEVVAANPELMSYFMAAVGAVNVVLRFLTNGPVYAGTINTGGKKEVD